MDAEKVCGMCRGCLNRGGCEEHHRRCKDWERRMCADHDGSSITAISSQFDVMTADLSSYQKIIEELREADMELDEAMDQIPADSATGRNPRYAKSARDRELDDETHHYAKLMDMLQAHREHQERLQEVAEAETARSLSTRMMYQRNASSPPRLPTVSSWRCSTRSHQRRTPKTITSEPRNQSSFPPQRTSTASKSHLCLATTSRTETRARIPREVSTTACSDLQTLSCPPDGWTPPDHPLSRHLRSGSSPRDWRELSRSGGPDSRRHSHPGFQATYGSSSRLLQQQSEARPKPVERRTPRAHGHAIRCTTTGEDRNRHDVGQDASQVRRDELERRSAEERLVNVRTWLDTRRNQVTAILVGLEETAHELSEESVTGTMDWLKAELDVVELKLKEIEKVEMDSWMLTTRTRGRSERATRSEAWTKWHQQICGKITSLKRQVWKSSAQQAAVVAPSRVSCHRTGGFLERVKLPTFTGHQEDYGEFKIQFLEMCRGEAYSAVIELAQLRQKLPKEALGLLVGLTDPSAAWKRLDERYGNREMSVIVALKRLKAFRPGKTASYDQIMEIAVAVQRCYTVLLALGKEKELIRDRETLSEVIGLMPSEAQQRWYHRKPPSDEDQDEKGEAFLSFLEDERSAAVSMHLDAIARKPVNTSDSVVPTQAAARFRRNRQGTLPASPRDAPDTGGGLGQPGPCRRVRGDCQGEWRIGGRQDRGQDVAGRSGSLPQEEDEPRGQEDGQLPPLQETAYVREGVESGHASREDANDIDPVGQLSPLQRVVARPESHQDSCPDGLSALYFLGTLKTQVAWRKDGVRSKVQGGHQRSNLRREPRTVVPRAERHPKHHGQPGYRRRGPGQQLPIARVVRGIQDELWR